MVMAGAVVDTLVSTMSNPFWKSFGIYLATDALGFIISLTTRSHVHLDLVGSGAFTLAALPTLLSSGAASVSTTQFYSSLAVTLWSTRLAGFLFYRATKVGHDMRLYDMLSNVPGMVQFWGITFLWNFFCAMPHNLGLLSSSTTASDPIFLKTGGLVFCIGLIIETAADLQKFFFKKSNPGKFCNVGLWSISQHPHYLGNLILWAGIFIMNIPGLIETPEATTTATVTIWSKIWSYRKVFLSLLSPLFMWALFSGQAEGTATNAMQLASTKYGNDPEYKRYLKQTAKIIPKIY